MLEHCYRVRISRYAAAKPGDRLRISLWFKCNNGTARYSFAVDARLEDATYPRLASVPISQQPGQWQQLVTEVTAPAKTRTIFLRLYINNQTADARCWIDDLFIGWYPK